MRFLFVGLDAFERPGLYHPDDVERFCAFGRAVLGLQGWPWADKWRLMRAAAGWLRSGFTCPASLTVQQFKVLRLVAEGRLNKQIAHTLGVQERTVKAHLSAIFEKLGVHNRTQAGVLLRSLELNDPSRRES